MEDNKVRRPVRRSDFVMIFAETAYNIMQSLTGFFESLYELSIYHANHKTETNKAWEQMSQDLEKLQEETDG